MDLTNLTSKQLNQAAMIKDKIEALTREFSAILGGSPAAVTAEAPRAKGKMSAAGRARIIAAQKLRWAKIKAAKGGVSTMAAKPARKWKMSAAAKAKIAAAARARWARVRAAKA